MMKRFGVHAHAGDRDAASASRHDSNSDPHAVMRSQMPTVLLIGRAGGRISTGRYSLLARASRVPGRVSRRGCVPFTKMDAPSPRHNYVVTALKPTLANACAHAVFTGPSDSNLVVA